MENLTTMIESTINLIISKSENIHDFIFSINHIKGFNCEYFDKTKLEIKANLDNKRVFDDYYYIEKIEEMMEGLK